MNELYGFDAYAPAEIAHRIQAVGAAKARLAAPGLAVLLVTGYAEARDIKDLVSSEEVLRKPFRVSDLAIAVRRALEEASGVAAWLPVGAR